MSTDSTPPVHPLTQHHVQILVRYAQALDNKSLRDWGANVMALHTDEVRALAQRISKHATEGVGDFDRADVKFLSEIGDHLVGNATRMLADSLVVPEQQEHARYRLGLGTEILQVRDGIARLAKG